MKASLIIISYNFPLLTKNCIESAIDSVRESNIELEIIVVDNNSDEITKSELRKIANIKLIENSRNLGYATAINIGVRHSNHEYLILSNSDVIYPKSSIEKMLHYLSNNKFVGSLGPQQVFPDNSWQRSFGYFPGIKRYLFEIFMIDKFIYKIEKKQFEAESQNTRKVEYIDGAVIATKKEVFYKIGGFDEDYYFYSEETDYCFKVKELGLQNVFLPEIRVLHLRGGSSGGEKISAKKAEMIMNSVQIFLTKNRSKIIKYITLKLLKLRYQLSFVFISLVNKYSKKENKSLPLENNTNILAALNKKSDDR